MTADPLTEAGRRLSAELDEWEFQEYGSSAEAGSFSADIRAIEAEAVAAERERIDRGVESLRDQGTERQWRSGWGDALDAILAIIRGEAHDDR